MCSEAVTATPANAERPERRRHQGAAAGGSPAEMSERLEFELLRSALYHDEREQMLARFGRFASFLAIVTGSGAGAAILKDVPALGLLAAGLTVLVGATALVYDFAGGAREHRDLKRRFYEILADLEAGAPDLPAIRRRIRLAYADEPPAMHAVNAVAHNRAGESLWGDAFNRLEIGPLHRILRHLLAFRSQDFPVAARLT